VIFDNNIANIEKRGIIKILMEKKIEKGYPYRNREILVVDLTKDEYSYSPMAKEIGMKYHGGRALSYKLWDDYADWTTINKECLYIGAPIIICLGVASDLGYSFASSSTVLSYSLESKSVVSYNFSSSKLALTLSSLGFSALVIKGRARRLTSIEILKDLVKIDLCESYHNFNTRDIENVVKDYSSLISIGAAGEKCIDYASLNIDSKNVGRAAIGAVFGTKNLKYIAFYNNDNAFRNAYFEPLRDHVKHYFDTRKQVNLLEYANKLGWAAVESYKYRYDPRLWGLGSNLTKDCKIDWLTALALGSNLGIYDFKKVEVLEECCLALGVDPFSISNYLIWIIEAESENIINLKIDKKLPYLSRLIIILEYLSSSKGIFEALSENVDNLSKKYGFEKNNFTSLKKELLPLDLRGLKAFSLATALDDDTLVPWELFKPLRKKNVAKALYNAQIYREICETLGISWKSVMYLANVDGSYKSLNNRFLKILTKVFAICEGYKISEDTLFDFGKRSFFHRRKIEEKSKENVDYSISNVPIHFLINRASNFKEKVVSVGATLDDYLTLIEYEKKKLNI